MFAAIVRGIVGLLAAFLAAGATTVLFVMTPADLAGIDQDKLISFGYYSLVAATQSAVFAVVFAVIAVVIGAFQGARSWLYYTAAGMLIALAGFTILYVSEASEVPSIVNTYALAAYLTTGFVGGFVYWLFAGGRTKGPPRGPDGEPPAKAEVAPEPGTAKASAGQLPAEAGKSA